ncbi:MAG: dockerin type I repeat-containing protein, partial [Muribaculaceae bacterium]|nr:dockerin type I repeat-containing protein [Muribaculaceae bacterium]
ATGRLTISSTEVSSNVTLTATYNAGGQTGGTEVVETWEECTGYGSYETTSIQGHAFKWKTADVGIWSGDANCNDKLSCRFGKTSDSYIEMAEDLDDGASKVTFYAANWSSNETAPTLQLQYSTNGGSTWTTAATCKPNATWQQYIFNVNVTGRVRFKILQTAGARLNIDDIAITSNPVVPAEPSLAITSIPAITAEQDGESTVVSATVTSENNTENITLSVEGNFLLSLDKRSWSSTLTLDPSGEVFYVRLAATSAVGDFEGLVSATTGKASAYADVNGTVTAKPYLQGDVNGDGTISITDVTSLIDYLLNDGGSAVDPSAADVDGDHTVSITDVTALIDLLLSAPSSMSMMWDAVPTAGGILVEHLSDGEVLEIYDMDAELRATVSKPGDQTVKLPAGTYVVAGDICSRKVVVK